jgi:8-oxo-dGTP diphosphatase
MSRVNVAVGVVINAQGEILVAKRLPHQHQGECWEFPGGKIEHNESVHEALKRELYEEVGLEVFTSEPWLEIVHDYTDKAVCLKVHKVTSFTGIAIGKEGQEISWIKPNQLSTLPWPKANEAIVLALREDIE